MSIIRSCKISKKSPIEIAQKKAAKKLGVSVDQLNHTKSTENYFVFETKAPAVEVQKKEPTQAQKVQREKFANMARSKSKKTNQNERITNDLEVFFVEKELQPDFTQARKEAANHFKTFPSNVTKVLDNETVFGFKKVRG